MEVTRASREKSRPGGTAGPKGVEPDQKDEGGGETREGPATSISPERSYVLGLRDEDSRASTEGVRGPTSGSRKGGRCGG